MNRFMVFIARRKAALFIAALLLLNFVLKYLHLTFNDIANDEPFSIFHAQMPFRHIIVVLQTGNNPPLYELLLHFWIKLFGIGAFSVRFPSLIFGVLTAPVIFYLAHKHFNFSTGVLASLLFTLATPHTYYAHEARGYTLFILLTALSAMFLLNYIATNRTRTLVWLCITDILLIYTHYFGFFVLLTQLLALPFFYKNLLHKKAIIAAIAIVLLSFIPMVTSFTMQLYYSVSRGTWVSPPLPGQYYGFLNIFLNNKINSLIFIALLVITLWFFIRGSKNFKQLLLEPIFKRLIYVFLCFFVPYTLMFVLSFKAPMFIERYVIFTSVFFYIFLAALLCLPAINQKIKILAILVMVLSMAATYNPRPANNRDIKNAVAYVKAHKSANTLVMVCPDYFYLTFAYHYNPDFFKVYNNAQGLLQSDRVFPVRTHGDAANVLWRHKPANLVFFRADLPLVDPDNKIVNLLEQHYTLREKRNFFEIFSVSVYQRKNLALLAE